MFEFERDKKEVKMILRFYFDFKDNFRYAGLGGGGEVYYVYDSNGERVRKIVEKQGGIKEERIYLGGYEVYRKTSNGNVEVERTSFFVTDGNKTIAQIDDDGNTKTIRYQYDNHLGSVSLELDEQSNIISYEEYHPFGTTSYRSGRSETEVSLKRYKYVGKERDNETGLYYYGARYYSAWLGRFVSVDPLQFDYPQLTPFNYAGNKPITHIDIDGMQGTGDDKRNNPPKINTGNEIFDKTANLTIDTYGFSEDTRVEINVNAVEGENVSGSISLTEGGISRTVIFDFQRNEFVGTSISVDKNYSLSPVSAEADKTNVVLPKPVIMNNKGGLRPPSFPIPNVETPQLGVSKMDTWSPEARSEHRKFWESKQAIENYEKALKRSDPLAFGGWPGFGSGYVSDLNKGLEQMPGMIMESYAVELLKPGLSFKEFSSITKGLFKGTNHMNKRWAAFKELEKVRAHLNNIGINRNTIEFTSSLQTGMNLVKEIKKRENREN